MIEGIDTVLIGALLVVAALSAWFAWDSIRRVRGIWTVAATPLSVLAVRPIDTSVTVRGTLHCVDASIPSWDGARCVAMRRTYGVRETRGNATRSEPHLLTRVQAEATELRDADATCTLDLSDIVLFGEVTRFECDPAEFRERRPDVWAELDVLRRGGTVRAVLIEEARVLDGASCTVSAFVSRSGPARQGQHYRQTSLEPRLVPRAGRPVIVALGGAADIRSGTMVAMGRMLAYAATAGVTAVGMTFVLRLLA